ncbi:MAG: septal ring lytic transglycosylase RlpA family protein [Herminiimonas sp.]|nr:septal ring lytic transglycosylase RlpA family protein [Herminiimonas sp.]
MACIGLAGCAGVRAPTAQPLSAAVDDGSRAAKPVAQREPGRPAPALPAAGSGRGGYYQDDGPGDAPPADLQATPDAEPKIEPYSVRGNKPYVVFGKTYTPLTDSSTPLKQRGVGSWYGKKFHGQKTSSGEPYDMYKMTAAHPTLPIPSFARVTNLRNGAQVIVRVNDRGPFHSSRIIDLSYTAALKLGYLAHGSSELEVERLLPEEIVRINSGARKSEAVVLQAPSAPTLVAVRPVVRVEQARPASAASRSIEDFLQTQEKPEAGTLQVNLPVSLNEAAVPTLLPGPGAVTLMPVSAAGIESVAPSMAPAGFYLQFGAFGQSTNAEASRVRMAEQWPAALPALEVRQSGTLYRLYSGPFGSRDDAVAATRLLPLNPAAKPMIVQR